MISLQDSKNEISNLGSSLPVPGMKIRRDLYLFFNADLV